MADVSNKTIALLTVIAVIASIGGVLLSMNQLGRLGYPLITGFTVSDTALLNLSITSTEGIAVDNNIDFGAGTITVGKTFGVFNSSLANCANGSAGSWTFSTQYIKVNNTGNTNGTINITTNTTNATTFIGGTTVTPVANFYIRSAPSGAGNVCT
jgi:hypothetical protein